MLKTVDCRGCGISKEIEYTNMKDVIDNGFDFLWDISNGLTSIYLCNKCAEKVKNHVHAIEDVVKIEISFLNFGKMSKIK